MPFLPLNIAACQGKRPVMFKGFRSVMLVFKQYHLYTLSQTMSHEIMLNMISEHMNMSSSIGIAVCGKAYTSAVWVPEKEIKTFFA